MEARDHFLAEWGINAEINLMPQIGTLIDAVPIKSFVLKSSVQFKRSSLKAIFVVQARNT